MENLPLSKVYQLLEPGPVALLTTALKGRNNVMTLSWHMMVDFEPPLIACVVSDRDYSHKALRSKKECVIAIPGVELAEKVVAIGNCSGRETDKFSAFRLTPRRGAHVSAPLVAECFANIECRVIDTRFANRYCIFILEAVKAWRDPARKEAKMIHHQGFGRFIVDGETIELQSKMP